MKYTESHKDKGGDYDEYIQSSPWDSYMANCENKILESILPDIIGQLKSAKTLDFACGTGRITRILEKYSSCSFGVDVSENMVNQAISKTKATKYHIVNILKDEYKEKDFDLITAFRFFGNAEVELSESVLNKLNSLLKKEGLLVLNNHRNYWSIQEILHRLTGGEGRMKLTHNKLKVMLERNGFKIIKKYCIGGWVIRNAFDSERVLNSNYSHIMELVSSVILPSSLCPDSIIIAKKV